MASPIFSSTSSSLGISSGSLLTIVLIDSKCLQAYSHATPSGVFWKEKPNFIKQTKKWNNKKINEKLKELYGLECSFKSNSVLNKEIALKKFIVDVCVSANS